MPSCRVYLFTYKRNNTLPRAVESLINQNFGNWICEVHNDDPEDSFPGTYITSLNDSRFQVLNHKKNLGPTRSFNLAYAGCPEDYASILEDDNWWEVDFLQEMINTLEKEKQVNIAWSNMFIWKESPENNWIKTGKNIRPDTENRLFYWPDEKQIVGALHSNGAMLYRGNKAANYQIPDNSLFNAVELIRERTFEYPLLFVAKPLANFSITQQTSQAKESWKWTGTQLMLLSTYLNNNAHIDFKDLLKKSKKSYSVFTPLFFLNFLMFKKDWQNLKYFSVADWFASIRWLVLNPINFKRMKFFLNEQKNVLQFLYDKTGCLHDNLKNGRHEKA